MTDHFNILLLTPPFTQLNTPYPATAYIKGFLNTLDIPSTQADLGLEVILHLFSRTGLKEMFSVADMEKVRSSANCSRIHACREAYIDTIDAVILFLQGHNPTLAHRIRSRNWLPEASRFEQADATSTEYGTMGIHDEAKYLATMYLEDLADFITECVDEHFGFSRYAERLGRSANTFDELFNALQQPPTFIDTLHLQVLAKFVKETHPALVCMSVPFPGNLYSAFRAAQWLKANYPATKTVMGGGFPNTELRSLTDSRVFEFFDFITLDDGETPLQQLIYFLKGKIAVEELKRTYVHINGKVTYINNSQCKDQPQTQTGIPDYTGLHADRYISVTEVANPMHSLWSDGFWNKLTMAHGCYWGKCTFCDTSIDYIQRYEPLTAALICDKMEAVMAQTGRNGFHFVDEAAPPALMREVALEIIRRKMVVTWWTNIRFEKSFTRDLCLLLRASGCIAVSGGLEVASDRLLALIKKGVTVEQVTRVNRNFTEAGIMVHAYLMYGFPTQTDQETIDALEMVRQMFAAGILRSAFWHQFALTAHSPVGADPAAYGVQIQAPELISFANNDLFYTEATGVDHSKYSFGLKKSLHNYMHGAFLDMPLHKWFDFKIPKPTVAPDHIKKILDEPEYTPYKPDRKVVFLGGLPGMEIATKSKKGATWEIAQLIFTTNKGQLTAQLEPEKGHWLASWLGKLRSTQMRYIMLAELKNDYEANGWDDFELFWDNKPLNTLHKAGLLQL